VVAPLHELDEEALVRILVEPKNALIKQYYRLFEMDNVKLAFTDEALLAVASSTLELKSGARGLRSVLEATLLDLMFEIPSDPSVREVVIDADTVEQGAEPLLIYADQEAAEA
jgi:ATP-dependent Clp protease ATP-binding subunit ClpX